MKEILKRNAEELRRLNQRIHETAAERGKSKEHLEAWKAAAKEFHEKWDKLAFPGGLKQEFQLLMEGNVQAATYALIYLENRPYSFGSQYIATSIRRHLNKIEKQLPAKLQERFIQYKKDQAEKKKARGAKLASLTPTDQIAVCAGKKKLSDFK